MGGKQSKQAIDMSSPKYNIYDTFNNDNDNHNNMGSVNTNYEFFYVYSVLMIIILVYNIILYTSIYLRRKMKSIYK